MGKNKSKDNTLIKLKNMTAEIKKHGIKRASPEVLYMLNKICQEMLARILEIANEEMLSKGRKTLKQEDIENAFNRMKREEISWEI